MSYTIKTNCNVNICLTYMCLLTSNTDVKVYIGALRFCVFLIIMSLLPHMVVLLFSLPQLFLSPVVSVYIFLIRKNEATQHVVMENE